MHTFSLFRKGENIFIDVIKEKFSVFHRSLVQWAELLANFLEDGTPKNFFRQLKKIVFVTSS